nr:MULTISPECIES: molybdopterin-dependent oxidoreductase [unclassified Actinoplanes]
MREAGVRAGADRILARSADGMTVGTSLSTALDGRDTMPAVGMNGEPLPLDPAYPSGSRRPAPHRSRTG